MTYWMRCYWAEDDTWFYFEVDDEDMVVRQVELQGSDRVVTAASSVDEWQRAFRAGSAAAYESSYGITADLRVSDWEGHVPEMMTAEEFEDVWTAARAQVTERSR